MTPCLLYITTSNREEAISIARELLEGRIIACANILDNATSLYWWQGEIEHTAETVIVAKSVMQLVPVATKKIKELHSYECPCIVALPIEHGNHDFLDWLKGEVADTFENWQKRQSENP